jgi:gamma-glutamylcyclotransferase (GGCT)/AIG2-like uncharacterized protein YtfP
MSELVFAYGSNMCSGRFRAYGVSPEGEGRAALLPSYRLVFNKRSQDGSGKANAEPHEVSHVWGVVYAIPDEDLEKLDHGEGAGYNRVRMPVRISEADITEAWVYMASRPSSDSALRPYTWYKRFLVEGAREHLPPHEYIAELLRIEAIQDTNEQRDREKRVLACRAAS